MRLDNRIGKKIGEGSCSEIFEWENGNKIIKLPKSNTTHTAIRNEYVNHRIAWESGVPVPQPFEIIDIAGRPGIVSERIFGKSLLELFIEDTIDDSVVPNLGIHTTAQILWKTHQITPLNKISSQKQLIKHSILKVTELSSDEKDSIIAKLDCLPVKKQLCHGDPNPGNILIQNGEAVLLDWANASVGNSEADLAEYILTIKFVSPENYIPKDYAEYFNATRDSIIKLFFDEYRELSGLSFDEVDAWILPIAARRLTADAASQSEKQSLINLIRKRLMKSNVGFA